MRADPQQTSIAMHTRSWLIPALACATLMGCMERIDSVPEFVQLAERHEREQNFAGAADAYSKAIALDSTDPSLWYDRGVANLNAGNPKRAIADYRKAVELDPEFAIAWNNLGAAHLQAGENLKAIQACSQAIAIDQLDPLPGRNRGLAYHRLGFFDHSIEDLTRAIQLDSENSFLHFSRGTVLLDAHQPIAAIEDFIRATELDEANPDPLIGLAVAFARTNRTDNARRALDDAKARGFEPKSLKVSDLPAHRRPPVPDFVADNLREAGYTETDGTWSREGNEVNLISASPRGDAVRFKLEQLSSLAAIDRSHTLVVVALGDDGPQVIRRIDDWKPNAQAMTPVEFTMPINAPIGDAQ